MSLTEEEAKKKWCPMYQISAANYGNDRTNRQSKENKDVFSNDAKCLASECMCWQWTNDDKSDEGYCGLCQSD